MADPSVWPYFLSSDAKQFAFDLHFFGHKSSYFAAKDAVASTGAMDYATACYYTEPAAIESLPYLERFHRVLEGIDPGYGRSRPCSAEGSF